MEVTFTSHLSKFLHLSSVQAEFGPYLFRDETVLSHHTLLVSLPGHSLLRMLGFLSYKTGFIPYYLPQEETSVKTDVPEIDFPQPQTWSKCGECVLDVPLICIYGQVRHGARIPQNSSRGQPGSQPGVSVRCCFQQQVAL